MEAQKEHDQCECSSRMPEADLAQVKSIIVNLNSSIRGQIEHKIKKSLLPEDEIELINFTNLSGRCGDRVIGANVRTIYLVFKSTFNS